jgi:outer membrane biosynthesis protein TonB
MSEREKKNQRTGAIVSIGVHAVLLIAFLFIMAWRAPDPPAKSPGIEINFGMIDAGSGDEQPLVSETSEQTAETQTQQEVSQPTPSPPTESVTETTVTEPTPEPAVKTVTESVTQPDPSPVVQEKESKPKPKPQPEVKEEPKKPEPKVDSRALMGAPSNNPNKSANQGDKKGATGDQGKEEGKVDARNLYGEAGGGQGGTDLKIAGWFWDEEPNKKDSSSETGRIVFEFSVDASGNVGQIKTVSTTVSPTVVQFYKRQLEQTTFYRTAGGIVPDRTTGTVTFIIKAR